MLEGTVGRADVEVPHHADRDRLDQEAFVLAVVEPDRSFVANPGEIRTNGADIVENGDTFRHEDFGLSGRDGAVSPGRRVRPRTALNGDARSLRGVQQRVEVGHFSGRTADLVFFWTNGAPALGIAAATAEARTGSILRECGLRRWPGGAPTGIGQPPKQT